MGFLFRENEEFNKLYKSIFHQEAPIVKRGDYCVINISEYCKLSGFLLNKKTKNLSPTKSRPIIIVSVNEGEATFVATTTDEYVIEKRPMVSTENCHIHKGKDDCEGMNLKRKNAWLFAKLTSKAKRWRFFHKIKIEDLKYLYKHRKIKVCGSCEEIVLEEILRKIEEFGEYV